METRYTLTADAVILAVPSYNAAAMIDALDALLQLPSKTFIILR